MKPLDTSPALIDQAYARLAEAIAEGTLAPGQRVRQEELAAMLGVSRQPVSHALQLLKRDRLVEESGKRALVIAGIEPERIRALYQVRTALDALAARLAAGRVHLGAASAAEKRALRRVLEDGLALGPDDPVAAYIQADVAFHTALYRLSGNDALEETVAAQWLHLKRSMGIVLAAAELRPEIWAEHAHIADRVLAGDASGAEAAAREHTDRSSEITCRRLTERAEAA
jgi:DNA-binding GntR family transcriptional regulator